MMTLLVIREHVRQIYNKYQQYLAPGLKFILVLSSLIIISLNAGFSQTFNNPIIMVIVALVCAFLALNIDILIILLIILVHLYALSPEIALTAFLIILVMYLLYFRYTLKDALVIILLPALFFIKIPYIIPLVLGLTSTPISIISIAFGTIIYFILSFVSNNSVLISNMSSDSGVTKMTMVLDSVLKNKLFILTFVSLSLILVIVYIIRRWSINHAPLLAIIAGGAANVVIMLVGYLAFDLSGIMSIGSMIVGSVISVGITYILQFVALSVDYSRTEYAQFEDDEYFYFVKAVPKIKVAVPEVNVKRINVQRTKKRR